MNNSRKNNGSHSANRAGRWSYNPLSANEEEQSILIAIALFHVITFFIVPSMKRYLAIKNVAYKDTDEFKELIQIFKLEIKKDARFLHVWLSSAEMSQLKDLRNQVNHDNLEGIFNSWRSHFGILRRLCRAMNDMNAEVDITRIYNLVNNGDADEAVRFRFRFSTTNRQPSANIAFSLTQIIFIILIKYVAKNLWRFFLNKNPQSSPIPALDIYINLKTAIAKQIKDKNFLGFQGVVERDAFTLSNCFFARNSNRHGQYLDIEIHWESFLRSIIKLLERLNHIQDAAAVRTVLQKLISARRNRTEIRFEDLFNL